MNPLPSKSDREASPLKEPPLWEGRPAWSEYLFLLFFAAVAALRALLAFHTGDQETAVIYAFGILFFVGLAHFLRATTRYILTRAGLRRSAGFFGRAEEIYPLGALRAADVEQGPLDRIFGIGTVVLDFKEGGRRERLRGLRDPEVVRRKIEALL